VAAGAIGHHRRVVQASRTLRYDSLAALFTRGGAVVLSGAGLSTDSGIPDYRGPTGLARRATPMTFQAFTGGAAARQRYWARSHLGWGHIAAALPNEGHRAVAELERRGLVDGVITQNVDGLHQAAGSTEVIELHGSLHRVRCLGCDDRTARTELMRRLAEANPDWAGSTRSALIKPDGDAVLDDDTISTFNVVGCVRCGGVLKPDVVFFGENVPPERVAACYARVTRAKSLVVLGSSLTVMSGLRFVRRAADLGIPVAIVNQGTTRGDPLASVRIDAPLGDVLGEVLAAG